DVGQHLAALVVDAEDARDGVETHPVQMVEQRVHGRRPWTGRAEHDVADELGPADVAARQSDFDGFHVLVHRARYCHSASVSSSAEIIWVARLVRRLDPRPADVAHWAPPGGLPEWPNGELLKSSRAGPSPSSWVRIPCPPLLRPPWVRRPRGLHRFR